MEDHEVQDQIPEKPKKKKSKALPVLIVFMVLGMAAFTLYSLTRKEAEEPAKPPVKRVVQASKQQVEAIKQEETQLKEVDKVDEKPITQIGETKTTRDIWDELRREAEREHQEALQAGAAGGQSAAASIGIGVSRASRYRPGDCIGSSPRIRRCRMISTTTSITKKAAISAGLR